MGRTGTGVEIRAQSIRLTFTFEGKSQRHTLKLDNAPLPPTPANVKYANRLAIEIRDKIRHGVFVLNEYFPAAESASDGTAGGQMDIWINAQRIESSTRAGYESAIKFWKNAPATKSGTLLGTVSLRALKLSHILTAIAARPDLSGKTVNNYVSVLREALELAVQDNVLASNPASGVPHASHQKPQPDPFARTEADAITQSMLAQHPGQVHNLVEFWMWTGLRTSEIFGLNWGNVDQASGKILVSEALVRGERKDRTKTAKARTVVLNSRALAAIRRQKDHTFLAGNEVFNDPRYGQSWTDERAFRRSFWTPTLKRLGIRYRRPYNMRHTYATAMLMAGMTPAFCAKQLGHSVEMFLSTYSKWMDGDQNDLEMSRMETALSSPSFTPESKTGT